MFNSKNLGALIVAHETSVKSWEDGQYNILNMSIEETYDVGMGRLGGPARSRRAGRSGRTSSLGRLAPCSTWSLRPRGQQSPRASREGRHIDANPAQEFSGGGSHSPPAAVTATQLRWENYRFGGHAFCRTKRPETYGCELSTSTFCTRI